MHSFVCRPEGRGPTSFGRGEYGAPSPRSSSATTSWGVQFHPEKSSRDGLRCCATSSRARSRRDPLPGHRHPRRARGAALEGRFEDETVYHDDPLEAARSWVDAGARYLHVVDLDGAAPARRSRSSTCARVAHETGRAGPVRRRAALAAGPSGAARGCERVIVGTAAFRDMDFLDAVVAAFGPRVLGLGRRAGREDHDRGLDPDDGDGGGDAIERLGDRGVSSFVYTDADRDGSSRAPTSTTSATSPRSVRGRFLYGGGIGDSRATCAALARPPPGQPRRRDRRQGARPGQVHDRRRPGGARRATRRPRATAGPAPAAAAEGTNGPLTAGRPESYAGGGVPTVRLLFIAAVALCGCGDRLGPEDVGAGGAAAGSDRLQRRPHVALRARVRRDRRRAGRRGADAAARARRGRGDRRRPGQHGRAGGVRAA